MIQINIQKNTNKTEKETKCEAQTITSHFALKLSKSLSKRQKSDLGLL